MPIKCHAEPSTDRSSMLPSKKPSLPSGKPSSKAHHPLDRLAQVMILALGLLLLNGCVAKDKFEATQLALNNCEDEKAQLEASNINWENRFDRESSRWEELEASIASAVPEAVNEFHEERARILRLVPEQVEAEVNAYLEDYFGTVMKGFQVLKNDNEQIKTQLAANSKVIGSVDANTQSISSALSAAQTQREAEKEYRRQLSAELADIVSQINTFASDRINCKNCDDRIKLNRKERDAVLGFHGDLINRLVDLQNYAYTPNESPVNDAEPTAPIDSGEASE